MSHWRLAVQRGNNHQLQLNILPLINETSLLHFTLIMLLLNWAFLQWHQIIALISSLGVTPKAIQMETSCTWWHRNLHLDGHSKTSHPAGAALWCDAWVFTYAPVKIATIASVLVKVANRNYLLTKRRCVRNTSMFLFTGRAPALWRHSNQITTGPSNTKGIIAWSSGTTTREESSTRFRSSARSNQNESCHNSHRIDERKQV